MARAARWLLGAALIAALIVAGLFLFTYQQSGYCGSPVRIAHSNKTIRPC